MIRIHEDRESAEMVSLVADEESESAELEEYIAELDQE